MKYELDKSNLRQVILDAPNQFAEGFAVAKDAKVDGNFERVVFFGEGGSAFPASMVRVLIANERYKSSKLPIPFMQNHTYLLTQDSFESALNVFCSYSGNTEETISTLKQAIEGKLPAIGMSSGGQLEQVCKEFNVVHVKMPFPTDDFQPRMGTGYFVAAMLKVLSNNGLADDLEDEVLKSAKEFGSKMDTFEKKGAELANKISGKTPLIWANQMYKELARVWSIKFNEHSKNPAFFHFFPELNHNLMVGMTHHGEKYFVIMLKDPADDPRNLRRYEITANILKDYGVDSEIIEIEGESVFEKLFESQYLADFAAYYLAEKNGTDPTPVEMVEELKKRLKS